MSYRGLLPTQSGKTVDLKSTSTPKSYYLGLFPHHIVQEMTDVVSPANRRAAISTVHQVILDCQNGELLVESLQEIMKLVTIPLNDSNIKIVLMGLEVLNDLVDKVPGHLSPCLCILIPTYMAKIGNNKYVVKQAGMKLLKHLMEVMSPMPVIDVIMDHGLSYKLSKIREETLNIVIASLLEFPASEFNLLCIIEKIAPLLADNKQKVRQACLETCMVLASKLGPEQFQSLVTAVIRVESKLPSNEKNSQLSLMLAFQTRLSRKDLPQLNEDGLVDHVVNVANGKNVTGLAGMDVDWILAASSSEKNNSPSGKGRSHSTNGPGPLKSAGKKLPWDKSSKTQVPCTSYSKMYLQQSQSKPMIMPSSSSSSNYMTNTSSNKGYLEIHHNGSDHSVSNDVFSVTWPRSNGYYSSFMKTTKRQISVDTSSVAGVPTHSRSGTLPAIGRPLSKPIVRNPLAFCPHPPPPHNSHPHPVNITLPSEIVKPSSPTQIEKNFLGGQVEEDQEYFSIPVDDSLLNSSLCSSLSSLCASRDLQSAVNERNKSGTQTVDVVSQIRKKAASWKADMLSAHCSTSTSPVGTPPLLHQSHTVTGSNSSRTQLSTLSAPVTQRKNSQTKLPKPIKPVFTSPTYQKQYPVQNENATINTTFTISEAGSHFSDDTENTEDTVTTKMSVTTNFRMRKNSGDTTSYRNSKLFNSPQHDPVHKPTQQSLETHVNDLELCPESVSEYSSHTMTFSNSKRPSPTYAKLKKTPPHKSITSPRKSSQNSSSDSNYSNSAPVYRAGFDIPSQTYQDDSLVELEPHPNPESAIREILDDLSSSSEEWEKKCNGLLTVRRLAAHHKDILLPQMQTVVLAVEKQVKNLRSQVARGAIACFGDMFAFLGTDMEQSLDVIVKALLLVGAKSNIFYREDVEKALKEMLLNISLGKCLLALINGGMDHNSTAVRRLVSQNVCCAVEEYGAAKVLRLPQDVLERTLNAIAHFLDDADVGVRYHARKALHSFQSYHEFEQIAARLLPKHLFNKVRLTLENLRIKGIGKPPPEFNSAKTTRLPVNNSHPFSAAHYPGSSYLSSSTNDTDHSKLKKRRTSAQLTDVGSPLVTEIPLPDGLLAKMTANDWKERQEAISELESFIMSHQIGLGFNIIKVFDVFNQRLNDKNSKVNLYALEAFQRFVPILGHQLQPVISTLVEALARTVASRYPAIHTAALNAIDALINSVDSTLLLPSFSSAAENGNARVQPIMLRKLAGIIPSVYQQKPALVQRLGLPVLWKMLASRSPATGEAKSALLTLCETLYECMGPALEASAVQLDPSQQKRLRELLCSLTMR